METFKYTAKNKDGEIAQGKIEAKDSSSALNILQEEKLYVTSLEKESHLKPLAGLEKFFKRIPLKEKIIFTSQIAIMIKSGLPILEAIKTVINQTQNKNMAKVLEEIIKDVSAGLSFSKALAKHPDVFNETYTKIIESGEKSGRLDKVMLKLSKDLEKDYDLTGKIRGALMYPAFILLVMFIIVIILLIYVIPQLKNIFEESGVQLPVLTRIIVYLSDFFIKFWWLVLIITTLLIIFLRRYLRSEKGSYNFDKLKLKTPVLKGVIKNIYMSRFTRSLSSLVSAGIPMIDVLETTKGVIGSPVFEKEVEKIIVQVESGSSV
ncbi:type II secretion system F family protein, partial [Patescibacteria group bacterium]|nr:type II secretion system F family protein [Patescibacteria group bacterium]